MNDAAILNCILQVVNSRSTQGWIIIDANYRVIYVNDTFCELWLCKHDEVLNRSLLDVCFNGQKTNNHGKYHGPLIETVETGRELRDIEAYLYSDRRGAFIWQLANTHIIRNAFGAMEYVVATYDVIDRFKAIEQKLDSLNMKIIQAFSKAIGARDAYTMQHSTSVAALITGLAEFMRLSLADVTQAYLVGIVHDIGKIGVPEHILNKPGRLTDAEFNIMKNHPAVGADILRQIDGFAEIADIVRSHHERYDGRGYPYQLAGEEIPLLSRMLNVCDSYDAMTSARCYRVPMTPSQALEEIERCAGSQFDPDIAAFFSQFLDQARVQQVG